MAKGTYSVQVDQLVSHLRNSDPSRRDDACIVTLLHAFSSLLHQVKQDRNGQAARSLRFVHNVHVLAPQELQSLAQNTVLVQALRLCCLQPPLVSVQ